MTTESPWPSLDGGAWAHVRNDDVALAPGIQLICQKHGLDVGAPDSASGSAVDWAPQRFSTGSLPVYALGPDHVLKLFPPDEFAFYCTEVAALRAVAAQLDIPTPKVLFADQHFGWPYILMTRCLGEPMRTAAARIERASLQSLMHQLGRTLAQLHAVPVREKASRQGGAVPNDWSSFVAEQRRTAVDRQRAHGLPSHWLDQIPAFLNRVTDDDLGHDRVLLHTEVMREHVLVDQVDGHWRCTGLIDFEPAMIGPAIYDFASVGLFVTETDRGLFDAVLDGYGQTERGPSWSVRCFACVLLHRYSNLPWYLERSPPPDDARTLDDLADWW
ncbi:MAG: aminoglycoside phosphotransferase family protein, partial [Myxococcota bacterium]